MLIPAFIILILFIMYKIFIYFSLTGNGDYVATYLKEKGFDTRKVIEKKKAPKVFFFRVLFGGFRAGLKLKGKLINYDNNVSDYDEVIIGSPIWNGLFPPAINSVLKQTDLTNKKLSFIFYSGSGDTPKVLKRIDKMFKNYSYVVLKEPKTHEDEIKKIVDFIK